MSAGELFSGSCLSRVGYNNELIGVLVITQERVGGGMYRLSIHVTFTSKNVNVETGAIIMLRYPNGTNETSY